MQKYEPKWLKWMSIIKVNEYYGINIYDIFSNGARFEIVLTILFFALLQQFL